MADPGVARLGIQHLPVWKISLMLASLFLAIHLLLPQIAGLTETTEQLTHGSWWLLCIVLILEGVSYAAYGELTRSVLASGGIRVSRWVMQRVAVVGASLGKTLPGGTTAATAVNVKALVSFGVPGPAALAAMAAAGVLSSAVLGLLLIPFVAIALMSGQATSLALGGIGAAVVVVAAAGLIPVAARAPDRVAGWVARLTRPMARGPVGRWLDPNAVATAVATGLRSLKRLSTDLGAVSAAAGWAALNWLADLAVLVLLSVTFGVHAALLSVPLVYVLGQLAASVPLTPGGVGVVETVMITTLTASGSSAAAATAAVLGWRLISHWLPILVGLALLPSLLRHRGTPTVRRVS